jgi:hypothetical protein
MIKPDTILINTEPESSNCWHQGFTLRVTQDSINPLEAIPVFLVPIANQILLAGKSLHMIRSIFKVSKEVIEDLYIPIGQT